MKTLLIIPLLLLPFLFNAQTENGTFKVRKNSREVYSIVEQMPSFPGGTDAMIQFLGKNTIYPDSAKINTISGRVYVNFVIEKDGSITNIKIIRGVHRLLNNEAIRVIQLMPKWIPGINRGKNVAVSYNIPINFKLR